MSITDQQAKAALFALIQDAYDRGIVSREEVMDYDPRYFGEVGVAGTTYAPPPTSSAPEEKGQ